MAKVTLDSIRQAAEVKYGSYDIEISGGREVKLRNVLRLTSDERAQMRVMEQAANDEGADELEAFRKTIRIVAATPGQAQALIDEIGEDLAVYAEILEQYGEGTQLGEASPSQT